jgi:septum formation protein
MTKRPSFPDPVSESSVATTPRARRPQEAEPLLVLASASPRRRALLTELGVTFDVVASPVDERPSPGEAAAPYAQRMARAKAAAGRAQRPAAWILAADTVVEIDGCILGKPPDHDAARAMLALLSGRTHHVLTAVVLLDQGGEALLDRVVVSHVHFDPLSPTEIEAYIATGEPFDKAGAYAVQGIGSRHVARVDGSYTCVVGLPMELVSDTLRANGLLVEDAP